MPDEPSGFVVEDLEARPEQIDAGGTRRTFNEAVTRGMTAGGQGPHSRRSARTTLATSVDGMDLSHFRCVPDCQLHCDC